MQCSPCWQRQQGAKTWVGEPRTVQLECKSYKGRLSQLVLIKQTCCQTGGAVHSLAALQHFIYRSVAVWQTYRHHRVLGE